MSVLPRDPRQFAEQLSNETAKADRKVRAITAKSTKRIARFEQRAAELERQVAGFLAGKLPAEIVDIEGFTAWAANGGPHVQTPADVPTERAADEGYE